MSKQKISPLALALYPLSLPYRLVVGMRNLFFEWGILPSQEFKLPVISVGNITVGGTGKTPHIEYLIDLLKGEFRLATLSRGYKRRTRHFIIGDLQSTATDIGDEPRQLKQKYPDITVAVDRRRVNGIRQLLKMANPIDVILLDDAFQHRYVKPGKSILLMDYNRLITDDLLLPAGRLREPASAMKRADIILVSKSPERIKPIEMRNIVKQLGIEIYQHLFFTTIEYGEIRPVFETKEALNREYFKSKKSPVILLTGIANPRPVRKFARSISTSIHEMKFPDHHAYTAADLEKVKEKILELRHPDTIVLTTEKDAMRIQELQVDELLRKNLYFVPIRVKFLHDDQEEFDKIILNYVRSNKRNNLLHKGSNIA